MVNMSLHIMRCGYALLNLFTFAKFKLNFIAWFEINPILAERKKNQTSDNKALRSVEIIISFSCWHFIYIIVIIFRGLQVHAQAFRTNR